MKPLSLGRKVDAFPPYLFRDLDKKKREAEQKGRNIISLAVGDPDLPTPAPVAEFAAKEVRKPENHRYPEGRGTARLRRSIADWHKTRHGIMLDPETEILTLIGSKEGLAHLPFALTDRGDTVLIPDPCYPAYKTGALLSEAKIKRLPLHEKQGFLPDFGSLQPAFFKGVKLLFLNYPNNPTGASADLKFYAGAVAAAKKYGFWIAQDAAYSEIFFGKPSPSLLQIPGAKDVAVEFYSLSKTYCMTGWRLAWMIGNASAVSALAKLKENFDSGQFNAIQETAVFCLENHKKLTAPIREVFHKRAAFFVGALKKAGWSVFQPRATFFVWAKPPVKTGSLDCVYRILDEAGVLVTPGAGFGPSGEGYARFSLTAPEKRIREAAARISAMNWKS
jgi:LL-diaminopimelate aminotransferase